MNNRLFLALCLVVLSVSLRAETIDQSIPWGKLEPNEQRVLAPYQDRWAGLPPERQLWLRKGVQRWQGPLTPGARARRRALQALEVTFARKAKIGSAKVRAIPRLTPGRAESRAGAFSLVQIATGGKAPRTTEALAANAPPTAPKFHRETPNLGPPDSQTTTHA